jgi:hypothetical protein
VFILLRMLHFPSDVSHGHTGKRHGAHVIIDGGTVFKFHAVLRRWDVPRFAVSGARHGRIIVLTV